MVFVLGGVLPKGCHSRAGVPTGARSGARLDSSLRGSARACHATTRAAAGDGTLQLSVCSQLTAKACSS